jgi:hypothetical protein
MKHMNMSVPRDCGIRYGTLSLALLCLSCLGLHSEKLARREG